MFEPEPRWIKLLLYGGIAVFLIATTLLVIFLFWDHFHAGKKKRRCPKCWYDMTGVPGFTCPECGKTVKREASLFKAKRNRWGTRIAIIMQVISVACIGIWTVESGKAIHWAPSSLLVRVMWWDPTSAISDQACDELRSRERISPEAFVILADGWINHVNETRGAVSAKMVDEVSWNLRLSDLDGGLVNLRLSGNMPSPHSVRTPLDPPLALQQIKTVPDGWAAKLDHIARGANSTIAFDAITVLCLLSDRSEPAASTLVKLLDHQGASYHAIDGVINYLGPRACLKVAELLTSDDVGTRERAIETLAKLLEKPGAWETLDRSTMRRIMAATADPESNVSSRSLRILVTHDVPSDVIIENAAFLIRACETCSVPIDSDHDRPSEEVVAELLARPGPPVAPQLVEILRTSKGLSRRSAARALGLIADHAGSAGSGESAPWKRDASTILLDDMPSVPLDNDVFKQTLASLLLEPQSTTAIIQRLIDVISQPESSDPQLAERVWQACNMLATYGPRARHAAGALERARSSRWSNVAQAAERALKSVDPH